MLSGEPSGHSEKERSIMKITRDLAWWYWMLTVGLLGAGIVGWPLGIPLAFLLCALQIAHFIARTGDVASLPVQVRTAYLLLLGTGLWAPMQWTHLMQFAGTSARILIGYCLLARILSLAPWNRVEPLSAALVRNTFLSMQPAIAPCGSVLRRPSFEG